MPRREAERERGRVLFVSDREEREKNGQVTRWCCSNAPLVDPNIGGVVSVVKLGGPNSHVTTFLHSKLAILNWCLIF